MVSSSIPGNYQNPRDYKIFQPVFKNNKYEKNICLIINYHNQIWENPFHRYYTMHGKEHSEKILKQLNLWLKAVNFEVLENNCRDSTQAALFILLSAIYLHDIGMQCCSLPLYKKYIKISYNEGFGERELNDEDLNNMPRLEFLEKIRENHAMFSYEMLLDSIRITPKYDFRNFRLKTENVNGEMEAIALICAAHVDPVPKEIDRKIVENFQVSGGPSINLLRLKYILRIADALDADSSRIDYASFNRENMWTLLGDSPPKFRAHIIKHHAVDSISLPEFKFKVSLHPDDLRNLHQNARDKLAWFIIRPLMKNIKRYGNSLNMMIIPVPSDLDISQADWIDNNEKPKIGIDEPICNFLHHEFCQEKTPQITDVLESAESKLWIFGQNLFFIANPNRRRPNMEEDFFYNLFLEEIKKRSGFKIRILIFNPLKSNLIVDFHNKLIENWKITPEKERSPEHKERPNFINDLKYSFNKFKRLQEEVNRKNPDISDINEYPILIKCASEGFDSANIPDPHKYGSTIHITHRVSDPIADTMSPIRERTLIHPSNCQALLWEEKMAKYNELLNKGIYILEVNIGNDYWQRMLEEAERPNKA